MKVDETIFRIKLMQDNISDRDALLFAGITYGLAMAAYRSKEAAEFFQGTVKGASNGKPSEIMERDLQTVVDILLGIE